MSVPPPDPGATVAVRVRLLFDPAVTVEDDRLTLVVEGEFPFRPFDRL